MSKQVINVLMNVNTSGIQEKMENNVLLNKNVNNKHTYNYKHKNVLNNVIIRYSNIIKIHKHVLMIIHVILL